MLRPSRGASLATYHGLGAWAFVLQPGRVVIAYATRIRRISMDHREPLAALLRKKSLVRGEFVLTSGLKSNYYLDCKLTTLDPEGAFLTGHCVLEALASMGIVAEAVGGLSMGADPVVSATIVVSHL